MADYFLSFVVLLIAGLFLQIYPVMAGKVENITFLETNIFKILKET